jgi:hypothetical protein
LIRYLYGEATEEESREINHALLCDAGLRQKLDALEEVKQQLDEAALEPSSATVLNILAYSRGLRQASPDLARS